MSTCALFPLLVAIARFQIKGPTLRPGQITLAKAFD
jgi:hypothetical protein